MRIHFINASQKTRIQLSFCVTKKRKANAFRKVLRKIKKTPHIAMWCVERSTYIALQSNFQFGISDTDPTMI